MHQRQRPVAVQGGAGHGVPQQVEQHVQGLGSGGGEGSATVKAPYIEQCRDWKVWASGWDDVGPVSLPAGSMHTACAIAGWWRTGYEVPDVQLAFSFVQSFAWTCIQRPTRYATLVWQSCPSSKNTQPHTHLRTEGLGKGEIASRQHQR